MTSTYSLFGISMQSRAARRKLVVTIYIVLAAICALPLWGLRAGWPANITFYALEASVFVDILIFGGFGRYGLIKPFANRPPRQEPTTVTMVRFQIDPLSAATPDVSSWKNDERELERRNLAHYRAYQPVTILLLAVFLFVALAIQAPAWLNPHLALYLAFSFGLVAVTLALTLPPAIILWTEPDILLDDSHEPFLPMEEVRHD